MKSENKTSNAINSSCQNAIPEQYRKLTSKGEGISLGNLAEIVTQETLPFLLMRLVNESSNEELQVNILEIAAKKLDRPTGTLLRMFREYRKNGQNKQGLLRFISAGELSSKSGPTDWLIKSYLDKGSLAMIFGKSGTLKSFAAIDIGLSVSTGNDWHGNPVGQGAVFYICGEGMKGIPPRLKAWEIHHGIYLNKVPFFVSSRPVQFLNEESAAEVVAAVNALSEQHGNPVLIIIDTLNRNFGDGDESNTADMTMFVNIIDTYLRLTYGCTVLIIHHTGLNNHDRARGSYSLYAALDWVYQVDRQNNILKINNQKSKDFENLPPVYLKTEVITLDWEEDDGAAMTSLILKSTSDTFKKNKSLNGANKIAFDALLDGIEKNEGKPIHIDTWRTAAYEAKISTSDKPDTRQKAFNRAKDDLLEMELIELKNNCWMPKPDTGHKADI